MYFYVKCCKLGAIRVPKINWGTKIKYDLYSARTNMTNNNESCILLTNLGEFITLYIAILFFFTLFGHVIKENISPLEVVLID